MRSTYTLPQMVNYISLYAPMLATFFCIVGMIATGMLAISALILLAYLLQTLLAALHEIVQMFVACDPIVRVLLLCIAIILIGWRFSAKAKVRYANN